MTATGTIDEELADLEQERLIEDLEDLGPQFDETDQRFIDDLVAKILVFTEEAVLGYALFPYQRRLAARIIESVLINDGEEITALQARQSGKTEVLAAVISSLMILLPRLAKVDRFKGLLGKYKRGFWVGLFAPTDEQVDTVYSRIVNNLTSDHATEMMLDPEIDEIPQAKGKMFKLRKSGSFCRAQTAHPRAKIESKSYHFLLIDEAQDVDQKMIAKSINPMGAFYNATSVLTGTPTTFKGYFYRMINLNKRRQTRRGSRQNHFQADWRECAKYNKDYATYVRKEMLKLGEDSDEFRMSYCLEWLLDRGLFSAVGVFNPDSPEFLGDRSMPIVPEYYETPIVFGCDVARETDSTVVTAVWVNWEWSDPTGLREHRILNWLELHGENWEEQYFQIAEFCSHYNGWAMAVDSTGMGGPVAERLALMMPKLQVVSAGSSQSEQSTRWKHLRNLMQRRMLTFPGHSYARRTRRWRRFAQQMEDLELVYKGPYLLAEAPDETDAHDDYCDSLALAVSLTGEAVMQEVEVHDNPFTARRRRRR